jgi:hypothetical protein
MNDVTRPALNIRRCEIGGYIAEIATIAFDDLRILFGCVINTKGHHHFERWQISRWRNNHHLTSRIIHTVYIVGSARLGHIVIVTHIEVVVDDDANTIRNIKRASACQGGRIVPLSTEGGEIEIMGFKNIQFTISQSPRGLPCV